MPNIFDEVRERVSMQDAVNYLGLTLTRKEGDQLRFPCPACKGTDKRALSVNPALGKFRCFAWDKGRGGNDATALVAHVRGISNGDAAKLLKDHFLSSAARPQRAVPQAHEAESKQLAPLDYLEAAHPVLDLLGVSEASALALGAGFAGRGTMVGRVLIPLRLPTGTLVGYLGIATKEDMSPLLLFPKNLEAMCTQIEPEEAEPKPEPDELRKLFRVV